MKYEAGYVVACLQNYELMKHEYEITYMDYVKELRDLDKNLVSMSVNYGERVQTSNLSDTTYTLFVRKEEKSRMLEKKIRNVEEKLEALERVVLVFKKFLEITPKHYYIVDRMLFSDRMKIVNLKSELNKGYDTIQEMKKNLVKAIGELARTDYSDEEILDLEPSEVWEQIDGELEKKMQRNEKG